MWIKKNINYFFGGLFSLVGFPFLIIGIILFVSTSNFISHASKVDGKVIDIYSARDSRGKVLYYPTISYITRSGETRKYQSTSGSYPSLYQLNEHVGVYYNLDPENTKIDSFSDLWSLPLIFSFLGSIISIIGIVIVLKQFIREKNKKWLLINGKSVVADVTGLGESSIEVNGQTGYQILAQWLDPKNNLLYTFNSEDIWTDPTPFIKDKKIRVFIDPNNPKRYSVDISFMPKFA